MEADALAEQGFLNSEAWILAQSEALGLRAARIACQEGKPAGLTCSRTAYQTLLKREAEAFVKAGAAALAWLECQEPARS